jgi:hypothetical protein
MGHHPGFACAWTCKRQQWAIDMCDRLELGFIQSIQNLIHADTRLLYG